MQKYQTVEDFLNDLTDEKKAQVTLIRAYISEAAPSAHEHVKWNAPSYQHNGEDRITCNTLNKDGLVKLVFHMGALRKENKKAEPILADPFSVIEWASDIRGYITFKDLNDVVAKEEAVKQLTRAWLSLN